MAYLSLVLVILGGACREIHRSPPEIRVEVADESDMAVGSRWLVAGRKLLVALLITALTIAGYSLYCLRFY